ncbi:MAG: alcohol dehydrogenase catalytic domain-containing protein, partial [Armatimonadetes bacterium]|nr:alcohol dehydrogenase catalytic domain-containing protein [Armatimonadota bacterium]
MSFGKQYRSSQQEIPAAMKAWQVFGAGLENFGRDKQPVEVQVPQPSSRELLARVDAASLCFSDVKILRLGGEHPRLYGRDLAADPIVPGHEAALTIVKVGSDIAEKFRIGDRFVVQADIFYQGVNLAFGYMLPGAFEQYVLLGKEILEGDEGLYLIPVQPETGYAEAALSEPWACVIHAYHTD